MPEALGATSSRTSYAPYYPPTAGLTASQDSGQATSTTEPPKLRIAPSCTDVASAPGSPSDSPDRRLRIIEELIALLRTLKQSPGATSSNDRFSDDLKRLGDLLNRPYEMPSQANLPGHPTATSPAAPFSRPDGSTGRSNQVTATNPTHNASFADNQRALRDALQRQGATPEETKLAMAIQAVESNDGLSHDASKDGRTDGARNYSPLNLNEDMLRRHRVQGDYAQLNHPRQPQDWDRVASSYLQAKRQDTDFINHLRNGYGGRTDTADYQQGLAKQAQTQAEQGLGVRANHHVDHR